MPTKKPTACRCYGQKDLCPDRTIMPLRESSARRSDTAPRARPTRTALRAPHAGGLEDRPDDSGEAAARDQRRPGHGRSVIRSLLDRPVALHNPEMPPRPSNATERRRNQAYKIMTASYGHSAR
jgi:hypothetical protein